MYITLAILVLAAIFFMQGKVRSDLVALCALVLLLIFNILTPEEALSGFSNSVVIMMVALFVVSGGIVRTGLAKMISSRILRLAGNNEILLFVLIMLVTSCVGAFISNTGIVAIMLPIVVSICASAGFNPSRFLMPLAFASSMSGTLTLIGTPPNLVIDEVLRGAGYEGLSMFTITPVGIVCVTVGILLLIPLSKMFLSKKGDKNTGRISKNKSLQELAKEYQLANNLFRVKLSKKSAAEGKTVIEMKVRSSFNITVLEIRRDTSSKSRFMKSISQKLAADTPLEKGDIIYLMGNFDGVQRFAQEYSLDLLDTHATETANGGKGTRDIDFYDIGIAEIVMMSTSSLINKTVQEANFRDRYNINILGVRRKQEYVLQDLKDEKLLSGDVLLVQGTWNDISRLNNDPDEWVVLGQPLEEASKVTLDYKAPVAGGIMVLMVLAMVLNLTAPVTAVIIAAVLMVITGCIKSVESAYKTINWESIVLIAAMMPMSLALEKTGTSEIISNSLVNGLGQYGPLVLLAGVYFATSLMTMFISNTATAVLLAPIAMTAAIDMGLSPYPFLFAVAIGASLCFASPFSTAPNALVMTAGQYKFMDYIKVGLPLQIGLGIVVIFILPFLFPFKV